MQPYNVIKSFFRRESLLCVCMGFAIFSMVFVPPSIQYAQYIDIKVLCLLFCLMAVVSGFEQCGLFSVLSRKLLKGEKSFRILVFILVLLPFFSAMLVTNDVALIAFVPLTITALRQIDRGDALVRIVVLQTIAANLGSMATPVGNPQNLYLYSAYSLSAVLFFKFMLPLSLFSLLVLTAASLLTKGIPVTVEIAPAHTKQPRLLALYSILFVLCLLSVFSLLSYWILTAIVLLCMFIFSPSLFKTVDYPLLLTFVCFFIFAGNMGQIAQVQLLIGNLLAKNTLLCAVVASQFISNVPAAVLLSQFTQDWAGLLLGVNIGGLGTPIASLASLISLKYYMRTENSRPLYYLGVFTTFNLVGLMLLLAIVHLLGY